MAEQALSNQSQGAVWLQLGLCQQALGLLGAAQNSFDQATQFESSSPEAELALASLSQSGFWTELKGRILGVFRK